MAKIIKFTEFNGEGIAALGGKGCNICKMAEAGFPVPEGFVVTTEVFRDFLNYNGIEKRILDELKKIEKGNLQAVKRTSETIKKLIIKAKFPVHSEKEVMGAYRSLRADYVAVRSSAVAEDSEKATWAGELESYLYVTEKNILCSLKKCWASLFSRRALVYQMDKTIKDIAVAVVIQKMVNSDVSGVAFSIDPVSREDRIVIEAGFGLGEAVVAGMITPDRYELDKTLLEIKKYKISKQDFQLKRMGDTLKKVELEPDKGTAKKLLDLEIRKVAFICQKLEKYFKKPQDVEWAYEDGAVYTLQSRPIIL
jgi:pyruvate,water dikinase